MNTPLEASSATEILVCSRSKAMGNPDAGGRRSQPSAMFSWRISLTAITDRTSLNTGTIEAAGQIGRGGIEEKNWRGHGRVGINGQPSHQVRGRIDGGGSKTVGAVQLQPDPAIGGLHTEQGDNHKGGARRGRQAG